MGKVRIPTWLCLVSLVSLASCQARSTKKFAQPEDMERYAQLPFATATHDTELRAELARVVSERGTPAQLASPEDSIPARAPTDSSAGRPHRNDTVDELAQIFPADTRDLLVKRLAAVYPDARFQFAPLSRGTARQILESSDARRRSYQRLMATASLKPAFPHALGIAADSSYLLAVEAGNRLLGLSIAEMLNAEQWTQSLESLTTMFRGANWLAREKHTLPRLAAAQRRAEALAALGGVARHPRVPSQVLGKLLELVTSQLSDWPADADAWIGERAEGLHTYELVRDGYLLSVLPFEDLRRFREELGVKKLAQIVADNLDADELYFLTTMRQVIAGCSQPYYQRASQMASLAADLETRRSSERYPFVADQLLLVQIEERQRLVAADRARCEAWRIALTIATQGTPPAEPATNPLTGNPYAIGGSGAMISIADIAPDEPVLELPVRSTAP